MDHENKKAGDILLPVVGAVAFGGLIGWALSEIFDDAPEAFISFAAEDAKYRTYLVGQSKNDKSKFNLKDKSLHKPFSNAWKTQTREIIKKSDVVILMIGSGTYRAEGAIWEIQTALEEKIPLFGIHINKKPKGRVPAIMKGQRVITWNQEDIVREIARAKKLKR